MAKKNSGEKRDRVSPEDFVKAWEACDSRSDALAKLGVGATARAARMRAAGVPLKTFPRAGGKLDVEGLAKLIGRPALPPQPKKEKKAKRAA